MLTLINGAPVAGNFFIPSGTITNAMIVAAAAISLNKLAAVTASKALVSDSSGFVAASSVTATELGYVSGVTSAIQTQFTGKLSTGTAALVNADVNASAAIAHSKMAALTASRAAVLDSSGFLAAATTTSAEIGFINGLTSAVQTQLNARSVLLASYNPSAAASVDITSVIGANYDVYDIFVQLFPATDDVELWVRTDDANGVSFDAGANDYRHGSSGFTDNAGATGFTSTGAGTSAIKIGEDTAGQSVGNAAAEGCAGQIRLCRVGSATLHPLFSFDVMAVNANGNTVRFVGGGSRSNGAAINAVQLLFESGNIASGRVIVVGHRNA